MFNKNGTETAGLKAEGLRNIRQTIKKTIEEVAESEGLGNISECSIMKLKSQEVSLIELARKIKQIL